MRSSGKSTYITWLRFFYEVMQSLRLHCRGLPGPLTIMVLAAKQTRKRVESVRLPIDILIGEGHEVCPGPSLYMQLDIMLSHTQTPYSCFYSSWRGFCHRPKHYRVSCNDHGGGGADKRLEEDKSIRHIQPSRMEVAELKATFQ